MTGIENHNFPTFHEITKIWREDEYAVISPAEMSGWPEKTLPWVDHMNRDIRLLLECDIILLLPGWCKSKGALWEVCCALKKNIPIFDAISKKQFDNNSVWDQWYMGEKEQHEKDLQTQKIVSEFEKKLNEPRDTTWSMLC